MKIAANIRILARFLKKKKYFLTLLTRFNTQGCDCAGVKACAVRRRLLCWGTYPLVAARHGGSVRRYGLRCARPCWRLAPCVRSLRRSSSALLGAASGGFGCGVLGPAGVWPPPCGRCAVRRRHCWGLRSGGNWRLGSVGAPRFAPRIGAPRDAPPMPSRQTPPQCSPQHCRRRPSPRPYSVSSRQHVLRYRSRSRRMQPPALPPPPVTPPARRCPAASMSCATAAHTAARCPHAEPPQAGMSPSTASAAAPRKPSPLHSRTPAC